MIRVKSKTKITPGLDLKIQTAIISTMDRISSFAQKVAKNKVPKDTGLLFNSIQLVREYQPPRFNGGIQTNLPYAIIMEEGRRPGSRFPPFLPIERWVIRHKERFSGAIEKFGGGKRGLKGLVFVIRRNIAKKGIPSNSRFDKRGFFKRAENAVNLIFPREINSLGLQIQKVWDEGG